MMRSVSGARTGLGTAGAVIAAVLVLLVALSPTLLLGQSLSAFGLILTGAGVLGVGLLVRWGGGGGRRRLGTILAGIGTVILILALGLTAIFLLGGNPGY
jgi:hypothetical protein